MPRLDVFARPGSTTTPFLLDVQANTVDGLSTRAVVPLVPDGRFKSPMRDLNPIFEIDGQRLMMLTQAIGTMPTRDLRRPVWSLLREHDRVVRALDILFLGF